MPRRHGGVNYTVGFKQAVVQASANSTENDGSSAVSVKTATLRAWRTHEKAWTSDRHSGEIYRSRVSEEHKPIVTWIQEKLRVKSDQMTTTAASVLKYMKQKYPAEMNSKYYREQRRMAKQIFKNAWRQEFGYEPIEFNIGVVRAVEIVSTRCTCTRGCGEKCTNREQQVECSESNCNLRGACSNRMWSSGLSAPTPLWIGDAGQKGYGVFAVAKVKKGTLLREYVGEVIDRSTVERRTSRGRCHYVMELTSDMFVDASVRGNHSRMINHDCHPNCQAQVWTVANRVRLAIVSLRTIQENEEITINYGPSYGLGSCLCSSCTSVEEV